MMMMALVGGLFVIMPYEKLHVLFGLILMTQYFTSVTTSVSLLSPSFSSSSQAEAEGEAKAFLSSSLSEPSPPSKSLLLSASSSRHPSSTHLLWPAAAAESTAVIRKQHQHHSKGFHMQRVPYSFHHFTPYSESDLRLPLMLERIKDEEEPIIKISRSSKHQKRHIRGDNNTAATTTDIRSYRRENGGGAGNGNNNSNQGQQRHTKRESKSEVNAAAAVATHQQDHLLATSTSPSILSSNGTSTVFEGGGTSGSQHQGNVAVVKGGGGGAFSGMNDRNRDFHGQCRHHRYFPPSLFRLDTCAWCYIYMSPVMFGKPSKKINSTVQIFPDEERNQVYYVRVLVFNETKILANVSDPESPIWQTFGSEEAKKDWTGCCQAAEKCCKEMVASHPKLATDEESELEAEMDGMDAGMDNASLPLVPDCPPTWDGWQCWRSTKAGEMAKSYCPHYIYFLTEPPTCSIPLEKECDVDGNWARRRGKEWTNYKTCAMSTVLMQRNRSYVLVTAYAISVFTLVPAVIIFFSFKQLRVHRIILHQNLFFSLIVNALLMIIFKTSVMMSETNSINDESDANSIVRKNSIACRALLISTKYSRMTNYMWMLNEGYYLHKLIAAAFAEQKSLLVFYLIGWVFPLFPTAFYAGFRLYAANEECWVVPQEEWEWALNGPSLLSLLVNALFLINIIRVLVTKLRAAHAQEPSQYRKAVRATLVLLPLFGLHFIVTIYRPSSSHGVCRNWTELYFYANDILDGMQGFLVALIFCYGNGEVLTLLKRTYTRWKEQHFDMGHRRNSRHRPSRGSVLGRSVVSTHIYSSIPPSPETNVIALPCGSNSTDPSPTSQPTNLLALNGSSGVVTISSSAINNSSPPTGKKPDTKTCLKNRKNHTSTATNGNAINMYVSSEYGCVKENPGVEISCV